MKFKEIFSEPYLIVEKADTPSLQQQGLMYRKRLDKDKGMHFIFKYPDQLRFWGLNTFIPLDVAFISDGVIKDIQMIEPFSTKMVLSPDKCDEAIEANLSFFTNNNISIGDRVVCKKDNYVYFIKNKE